MARNRTAAIVAATTAAAGTTAATIEVAGAEAPNEEAHAAIEAAGENLPPVAAYALGETSASDAEARAMVADEAAHEALPEGQAYAMTEATVRGAHAAEPYLPHAADIARISAAGDRVVDVGFGEAVGDFVDARMRDQPLPDLVTANMVEHALLRDAPGIGLRRPVTDAAPAAVLPMVGADGALSIRSLRATGRWRAGMQFTQTPKVFAPGELSRGTVELLRADPEIAIEPVRLSVFDDADLDDDDDASAHFPS